MLDEADFRARYDAQNFLSLIGEQPQQLLHQFDAATGLEPARIKRVVVTAMGGSALASELVKDLVGAQVPWPIEVVRDYALPAYVDAQTLVVCASFSGSSEETLAAFHEALGRGAQVVVMAGGGELLELARAKSVPHYVLPAVPQGRYGVLSGVAAWAQLLEDLVVDGAAEFKTNLVAAVSASAAAVATWVPASATPANEAKQMAEALLGQTVVVYAGPGWRGMAWKWKVDLNENAKNAAFWNVLPEMNHNELSGWTHPAQHGCKVVELLSPADHPQVTKRFEVMNRILSNRFAPITVEMPKGTLEFQMVWCFMLGSYASAYLAILNQVDIAALPLVKKLKERL